MVTYMIIGLFGPKNSFKCKYQTILVYTMLRVLVLL